MKIFNPNDILINIVPGGVVVFTFLYLIRSIEYITSSESFFDVRLFIVVSFVLIEASTEIFDQPSWYPVLFTETVVIAWNPLKLGQQLDHRSALLAKIPGFKSED